MELTKLSLAPTRLLNVESNTKNSNSEPENYPSKKRKLFLSDHDQLGPQSPLQASVDLHVNSPLPLDWEQCLDLESGKKYYLNRKTLRKSWSWPKDQVVDLELNMSSSNDQIKNNVKPSNCMLDQDSDNPGRDPDRSSGGANNTVALACLNCYLLVILSKTSPVCPNCKYLHSLPAVQGGHLPLRHKLSHVRPLNTLSLLN